MSVSVHVMKATENGSKTLYQQAYRHALACYCLRHLNLYKKKTNKTQTAREHNKKEENDQR